MEQAIILHDQELAKVIREAVRSELRVIMLSTPTPPKEDQEGGVDFAMDVLKVYSKSTIYRLSCQGRIPHTKRGKALWFKRSELMDWLKDGASLKRESLQTAEIEA